MKQKIYTIGIVSSMFLMTGTIFKIQHWPGASILLFTGTILLLAAFLPAALINHYKVNGNKQYKLLYIIIYVTCFVVFTSMLFKILHWPFAGYLVLISIPFPFIVFLPVWLNVTSKIRNFDINNTIFVLFLLAFQAVFSALLALNVTREKIDSTLMMTTQLSSFNAKIESLTSETDKSAFILSADDLLVQIEECRQLLYKRTGISRESLNKRSSGERYFDSPDIATEVLLLPGGASPAMKLESLLRNFMEEMEKLPGCQDIAKQAGDLFELTGTGPDQNNSWQRKMFADNFAWVLVNLDEIENNVRVIKQELTP